MKGQKDNPITPTAILEHIQQRIPDFTATAGPEPLSGGQMNYVWRVPGRGRSIVVKYAPPHIATLPDVPLNPERVMFEARCLALFRPGHPLAELARSGVRPPALLDIDAARHILIQEDVGPAPDLGRWLRAETSTAGQGAAFGAAIGQFIGDLHRRTFGDETLRQNFNNITIQESRLTGQYSRVGEYLRRGGISDATALGLRALELGQEFLQPGRCLIMGDLWPPSVLVAADGLRVIDWEFTHFGRPAQDVSHLAAHLWMHSHRAPSAQGAAASRAALDSFLHSYRQVLGNRLAKIVGAEGIRQCGIHFGAEILARTVGTYQPRYLYHGLSPQDAPMQEAVLVAAAHIRAPENAATFAALAQ